MKTGWGLPPMTPPTLTKIEHLTLATDEKSSRKIANSKYDPIVSEMSEMSGRTAECWHTG